MCSRLPCSNVKVNIKNKQHLFRRLSVQLLIVLIAVLDDRLLTSFRVYLLSFVLRPTC